MIGFTVWVKKVNIETCLKVKNLYPQFVNVTEYRQNNVHYVAFLSSIINDRFYGLGENRSK